MQPEERVAALYARVIDRVCARFHTRGADDADNADAAALTSRRAVAELLEQRWRERIACYTGRTLTLEVLPSPPSTAAPPLDAARVVGFADHRPDTASSSLPASTSTSASADPRDLHGRPLPQLPTVGGGLGARPTSVFAQLFQRKRRLDQVDGTAAGSGTESDAEADSETADAHSPTSQQPLPSANALVFDVSPVSALRVSAFPLQCAAREVSFTYKGKKRGFAGKWRAIVLTLVRPLRQGELMLAGRMLWLPRHATSECEGKAGPGETVEVVVDESLASPVTQTLSVRRTDASVVTVACTDVRHFDECVVAQGIAHLRRL